MQATDPIHREACRRTSPWEFRLFDAEFKDKLLVVLEEVVGLIEFLPLLASPSGRWEHVIGRLGEGSTRRE
ncbi:hypothetical protein QC762_0014280 [Podospora pseudocomata]|uniref:Uncharacterized protein n=3 Tax=Podospora TaxID=5144 RepID=A0ABR0I0T8_9PEZI|nr:hypothetical protein QC762_0014280 [Podospora pseudocomata]KAK4673800.1 hypothetical protein QC763_0017740 [Podospora pseudopauciseta]KAK4682295.1 hypothetical protein QC764_0017680 [Podospora pseudoanserina]